MIQYNDHNCTRLAYHVTNMMDLEELQSFVINELEKRYRESEPAFRIKIETGHVTVKKLCDADGITLEEYYNDSVQ